jgi:hypothetical protein
VPQGWPTAGGPGATATNAERFMRQLVRAAAGGGSGGGGGDVSAFVFEAFDETRKAGDGGAGSVHLACCTRSLNVRALGCIGAVWQSHASRRRSSRTTGV